MEHIRNSSSAIVLFVLLHISFDLTNFAHSKTSPNNYLNMPGNFVYPQLQVLQHAILFKKDGVTSLWSSTAPLQNWWIGRGVWIGRGGWIGRGFPISSAGQLTGHHIQRFFPPDENTWMTVSTQFW